MLSHLLCSATSGHNGDGASANGVSGACYCTSRSSQMTAPSEMVGEWVVAQVLAHHEKSIAAMLARAEVLHYLPLYIRTQPDAAGKTRHRHLPLFPGYLFVCCRHEDDRYELSSRYNTQGQKIVYDLIEVNNQKKFVKELSNVHLAVQAGDVQPYKLPAVGDRCCISSKHPMRGVEGTVVRAGKRTLFVLEIETLGRALECSVPPEFLEIID